MASWNLGPMRISLWHGESGGHGHSMQSFAYPVLIGCFGKAIVGSMATDTASLATAHYRRDAILATHGRTVPDYRGTPSLISGILKRKPGAQLHFASRRHRHGDRSEMRRVHVAVRRAQVHLIERVECFGPELE